MFLLSNSDSNKKISIAICSLLFYPPIIEFVNMIFNFFVPSNFIYDTIICYLIAIILVLRGIITNFHKGIKITFFSLFGLLFIYFFTMIIFPQNVPYMFSNFLDINNAFYSLFIFSFPCFILVLKLTDIQVFVNILRKFSYIVSISLLLNFFLFPNSFNEGGNYMVFSYYLLVPTCFLFYDFFANKSKMALCTGLVSAIAILISGARGALICLLICVILLLFLNFTKQFKQLLPVIIVATLIVIVIITNFSKILVSLDTFLIHNNIQSRTISTILNQQFFNDSGRNEIRDVVLEGIKSNPITGVGLFGDRAIIHNTMLNGVGTYSHNIILEMIVEFGVVLGSFILIYFFSIIIRVLLKSKNILSKNLVIIFMSSGFIKLFFSGSYLNEPYFFTLIGLCVLFTIKKGQLKGVENIENSMVSKYNITPNSTKFINKL